MTDQLALFADESVEVETNARRTDPTTSHEAVRKHRSGGTLGRNMTIVLGAVRESPGLTAGELGEKCGLGHIETQRRLSDLKRQGFVVTGDARACTFKGSRMRTWNLVGTNTEVTSEDASPTRQPNVECNQAVGPGGA